MSYYLDTSFIVPYYCQEKYSVEVQNIFASLRASPYVSSLTLVELHSTLARKIREKELTLLEATAISSKFKTQVNKGLYKKLALQKKHYIQAENWLKQFHVNSKLRSLDAVQLSAAAYANLPIFTLDVNLLNAARLFNIPYQSLGWT